jgi:hypothetical protein
MKKEVMTMDFAAKIEDPAPIPCKVCGSLSYLFDVVDFNKFCNQRDYYSDGLSGVPVYYRKCESCGLVFTTVFDALEKVAFAQHIYNDRYVIYDPDYMQVRPRQNAEFLANFLQPIKYFVKGLDYGGGNGLTASLLVNEGWNFSSCDPITNHVSPSEDFGNFNVITAIEVFEHIPFPKVGMEDLLSYAATDCLLIVGTLTSDNQMTDGRLNWWYAGPRNGHITLHSQNSLRVLFARYGFSYCARSSSLHIGIRGEPPDPRLERVIQATRPITRKKIKRWFLRRLGRSLHGL